MCTSLRFPKRKEHLQPISGIVSWKLTSEWGGWRIYLYFTLTWTWFLLCESEVGVCFPTNLPANHEWSQSCRFHWRIVILQDLGTLVILDLKPLSVIFSGLKDSAVHTQKSKQPICIWKTHFGSSCHEYEMRWDIDCDPGAGWNRSLGNHSEL